MSFQASALNSLCFTARGSSLLVASKLDLQLSNYLIYLFSYKWVVGIHSYAFHFWVLPFILRFIPLFNLSILTSVFPSPKLLHVLLDSPLVSCPGVFRPSFIPVKHLFLSYLCEGLVSRVFFPGYFSALY